MKSGSPLFEQIDKSIDKKVNLFSNSFSRYAVRAMLACLSLSWEQPLLLQSQLKEKEFLMV